MQDYVMVGGGISKYLLFYIIKQYKQKNSFSYVEFAFLRLKIIFFVVIKE